MAGSISHGVSFVLCGTGDMVHGPQRSYELRKLAAGAWALGPAESWPGGSYGGTDSGAAGPLLKASLNPALGRTGSSASLLPPTPPTYQIIPAISFKALLSISFKLHAIP